MTVRMGEVETLKEAVSRNLRVRVFVGNRTATSQTSDLSLPIVTSLVDETVEMAKLTSEDGSGGLPEAELYRTDFPNLEINDPTWNDLKPEQRIEWARRAEAAAFHADPAIQNSEGGMFEYVRTRTVVANTHEFIGAYEGTEGSLAVVPIARSEAGMQRDYWASASRRRDRIETPEEVGRRAAARAVRRLGARKVKTCRAPVVFDPLAAQTLINHVFQAASGDAVYRKNSFLGDQLGQETAAPIVTILDDARMTGGLGSAPFDDEGVPTQTTPVVERGILRNYLHSAYTARKLGARPTGNGSRHATGAVGVGPTNFFLMPGEPPPEEIVSSVQSGLFVVELIGFGVNTVTGDFSKGAVGLWIENGRLTYPVHEITIAGNLRQMLCDIEMIGNDLTFIGQVAAPTMKIRSMVISGE